MAKKIGITLALDNEAKFSAGMKNAQSAARNLDKELKSLTNEYKTNANSLEFLEQKQKLLEKQQQSYNRALSEAKNAQSKAAEAYRLQAKEVEEYRKSLEEARQMLKGMDEGSGAFKAQAKEIESLQHHLSQAETELVKYSGKLDHWDSTVAKAEKDIKSNNDALDKNAKYLNEASNSADKCAHSINSVGEESASAAQKTNRLAEIIKNGALLEIGSQALKKGAELIKEGFEATIEVGSEFEASMSEVEAISGASGNSLDQLGDKAKQLGSKTKFSASEVAQAYKYMGMAGWDAGQMLSGVEGILNLAAASGEDLATTSDIVTDDLTAFGMAAEDAGRMADVLAAASTNSNTNVSMLGETFKYAGSVAGAFGYTLEDVSVAAGLMANAGIKGSQAGTALRSIMTRLATDAGASSTKLGALGTLTEKLGVEFYNTDGSMRKFSDVLADTRQAWSGLTQEQQSNYANTIAGKNAMSGFLALMNAAPADFDKLTSAINNSNGAAEKMSGVMQDNLQGSVTKMKSAAEGLGIAVFEGIKGPLTGLADLAADAMSGITDAITPQKSEIDDFLEVVQSNSDAAADSFEKAQKTISDSVADVGALEHYKTVLIELNDKEGLNELQKWQLKEAVDALKGSIPELGDAYDTTTGKVNLEREAIEKLIEAQQDQIIENAKAAAKQEATEAMFRADLAVKQSEAARDAVANRKKAIKEEEENLNGLLNEYNQLKAAQEDSAYTGQFMSTEEFNSTKARMEEIEGIFNDTGVSIENFANQTGSYAEHFTQPLDDLDIELQKANDLVDTNTALADAARETYKSVGKTVDEAADATKKTVKAVTEETLAQEENKNVTKAQADQTRAAAKEEREYTEANKNAANAVEETTEAAEEQTGVWKLLADAVKGVDMSGVREKLLEYAKTAEEANKKAAAQAEAVKNAFRSSSDAIKDAWESLQDSAKQTLTFSLEAQFDGGADLTTETMNANLQSQLDSYREYVENLEVLRQAVAEGIITPEFFTHLEQQGASAANEIQHMAWTLNNQSNGEEEVRGISDKWMQALDMQDEIALIIAGDQAALADGLKSMGSSDKEYADLQAAISSGLSGATDTVKENVNDLAETAKAVGAKIPEGLTEAISSGEISATYAKEQLEASITGAMSGLADIAQENGADISSGLMDSLSEAIESGDYTAVTDAYSQMISSLADIAAESSATDDQKTAGEDAGNAYAEGIETTAEAAGEAAEAIKEAVTEKLTEVTVFTDAGTQAAEAFAEGLNGGSETVQEAASGLAQAAADAIHTEAAGSVESLMATGKAIGTTVTGAIGTDGAGEAGDAIAGAVKSGVAGKVSELQTTGKAIGTTVGGAIGTDEAKSAGENIADAVKSGIAGKVANLQTAGSAIGTTVGGAIGTDSATTAGGDISEAVKTGIASKVDKLQMAGSAIADNVLSGMTENSDILETAGKAIAESIISGAGEDSNSLIETGKAYTNVIKSGMVQGVEEGDLGGTLSGAINDGVAGKASELGTTGQNIASAIAGGIIANSTAVHTAAAQLASMAKIAAGSNVGEFNGVGINMAAGIAAGIASGQSNAINAAANMAAQALAAAKRALDIKSPSKKFQKEVGRQIGKGMAFGIRQSTKDTTAEAESLSNKTLAAASKWITKYNKEHKQKTKARLENERYFWQQVAKVTQKGTDAYYTAMAKSGFGVSWYKTTGSGKNKKTVKKDAETYYGEVFSAAQDFFDRLTMNQDMSIKSELAYWQKVQSGLKKGTTAYVQAAQKIKSIKEKIGGFDVAADILDSFQIYQDMSEKAVMDYWDLIRRQYETGTEDRMKADEKYLDAKKRYNEKLKDLEQDYADAVADKNRELAEAIEDRMANIAGAYDLFEEYTSEAATGKELLFNIQTQAEGYKFWREQLQALEARGILGSNLMGELSEKGPNESAAIYALNSLSDEELAAYNQAYQQKMDLARLQATEDEKDLAAKISDEIESLTDEYSKQLSATNENLNTQMASLAGSIKSIASDQTAQIVAAIVNQGATAQQAVAQVQQQQADNQAAAQAAAAAQAEQAKQQAAQQKRVLEDKIMAVVSGGKKTSKTNSNYGQLRNYVISKFGYDIGSYQNDNILYQKLGKIFGLSVNKTATGPQRTAILNAIKAAGFRRGTRRVPVWMDEDGPGSEMVISRSDNAILTRVPAGSAIAPANLTDNLWQWGSFAPAQFLAQMDRRQAAMTAYVERMVGSTVSMAGLNNRLATVNAVPAAGGGFSGEGLLQRMFDLMAEYLPHIEDSRNTYLDKDLVTKAMSDNVSRDMALRSRRVRQ